MPSPHIRTELPGPKARALLERDRPVSSPSYPRDYPFVMAKGRGVEVWDVDGNRFLDFAAGIAVCSTGHSHPKVVQAIKDAADDFLHISSDYWHERMTRLAVGRSWQQATPEQRQAALAMSSEARQARTKLLNDIKDGKETISGVLARAKDDTVVGKTKVAQLVKALPGYGPAKVQAVMAKAGIPEERRVAGLGQRQREALLAELN